MRTMTWGALAGLVSAALVLTGCSTTAGNAEPAVEPSITVTETVTESAPTESTTPTESSQTSELPTSTESEAVPPGGIEETSPPEATNPPPAADACATADLDIGLQMDGGAAGSVIYDLTFTNTSDTTCTLHGFPEVSYVRGNAGVQVGAPAAKDGKIGKTVTLAPGDTARAMLQQVDVYNFDADTCHPVKVRGLRVYPPGQDKAAFVPQQGATGCDTDQLPGGQFQMSVQTITAES